MPPASSDSSSRASATRAPSGSSSVNRSFPARSRSIANRRTSTCTRVNLRRRGLLARRLRGGVAPRERPHHESLAASPPVDLAVTLDQLGAAEQPLAGGVGHQQAPVQ